MSSYQGIRQESYHQGNHSQGPYQGPRLMRGGPYMGHQGAFPVPPLPLHSQAKPPLPQQPYPPPQLLHQPPLPSQPFPSSRATPTATAQPSTTDIYYGPRGEDFRHLIEGILQRGRLKAKYICLLTLPDSLAEYSKAFTAMSADPRNNYENYEQLGDVASSHFMKWYFNRRFPQLDCPEGVGVISRLQGNYGAKQSFYDIGMKLGLWDYISAAKDCVQGQRRVKCHKDRNHNKKDLVEDCFEAFLGCTEYLLDKHFRPGVGYAIVYEILQSIFDEIDISLRYEDLFDSVTILKQLFDRYGRALGTTKYVSQQGNRESNTSAKAWIYLVPPDRNGNVIEESRIRDSDLLPSQLIGEGESSNLKDARKIAAQHALNHLARLGYKFEVPEFYHTFCK